MAVPSALDDDSYELGMASERVRTRALWAGSILALSIVIPFENERGQLAFLWQLWPELSAAGAIGAAAPCLFGIVLLMLVRFRPRRTAVLATVSLAGLGTLAAVTWLAARVQPWDQLALPVGWTHRAALGAAAVGLVLAALQVARCPPRRFAVKPMYDAAALLVLVYLVAPFAGSCPLSVIARAIDHAAAAALFGFGVTTGVLAVLIVWPAIALFVSWRIAASSRIATSPPGIMAALGLPVLLTPIALRAVAGAPGSFDSLLSMGGGALVLGAILVLVESSATWLGNRQTRRVSATSFAGSPRRVGERAAFVVPVVITIVQWAVAAPDRAALTWRPRPASRAGDELFGQALPHWNDARARQDLAPGPRAYETVSVRTTSAEAIDDARGLDPQVGSAVELLIREAGSAGMTQARWMRLVARVNQASRLASLPYYVDPTEMAFDGADASVFWFRLDTYRIEQVRSFRWAGEEFPVLHVRWLTPERKKLQTLGLSRDLQPFAVVSLDAIDSYVGELRSVPRLEPPRCATRHEAEKQDDDSLVQCGALLRDLVATHDLRDELVRLIERHELQHLLDAAELRRPALVSTRLAGLDSGYLSLINRELSATIAQFDAGGVAPHLSLVRMLRSSLIVRKGEGFRTAFLVFEALTGRDMLEGRRENIVEAFALLAPMPDEELRTRARAAWQRLYGAELPSPVDAR